MYCPGCGSNNVAGTKFCTTCGTNLAVVTDALSGRLAAAGAPRMDETMLKVIQDHSKGQKDSVTGGVMFPLGLLVMTILHAVGMSWMASFWIVSWMFFLGAIVLAIGLGRWVSAGEKMKALSEAGLASRFGKELQPNPQHRALPGALEDSSFGQVDSPPSVTEGTTRRLE